MQHTPNIAPSAQLLISSQCPHCKAVLAHLSELVKSGELAHLSVDNVDQLPELAHELGVRALPWIKIGEFEFTGVQTLSQLREWIQRTVEASGKAQWFTELMSSREVESVVKHLEDKPEDFDAILELLGEADTELVVRIGIGVVMESFAGQPGLQDRVPALEELCKHEDPRVRADSCHYLGLSGDIRAIGTLQECLNDNDADVRESAADALEALNETRGPIH